MRITRIVTAAYPFGGRTSPRRSPRKIVASTAPEGVASVAIAAEHSGISPTRILASIRREGVASVSIGQE